ncbi:MAG: GAF domain-containing sensor histidine kinase [Bacteroidota bacterium]
MKIDWQHNELLKSKFKSNADHSPSVADSQRLHDLFHFDILDTPPEPKFDALTELAKSICDSEMALITFLDDTRQWFKSKIGVEEDETPLEYSFCLYTIEGDEVYEVPDATKNELFKHNPLVVNDPKIRFYAGAPLVTSGGHRLGTICVVDRYPKKLTKDQKKHLSLLANQVVAQLELRKYVKREVEASEQKAQFATMVSHQFRTPITAIQSNAELVNLCIRQNDHPANQEIISYTRRISDQVKSMTSLLDDVLLFGQLQNLEKSASKEILDIAELCDSIIHRVNSLQKDQRQANLKIHAKSALAYVNKELMEHALVNFLSNAFKYSYDNPEFVISTNKESLIILIADKGIGIPVKAQEHLFEPFFRAENVSEIEGTGLGLLIAKEFIELNNGTVKVESKPGKGTQVHLTFPLASRTNSSANDD